jgi:hypothetical protein
MIKKITILPIILVIGSFCFAQNKQNIKIQLTERTEDDNFKKSMAIVPVYKFTSTSIEPYTMFGVDPPKNQKNLEIKTMPVMKGMSDTAYSFIYFSGADNAVNQGYLLAILGNYRRSLRTIYFFVDKNNNMDFTDDGPADSMIYHDRDIKIQLNNLIVPTATYQLKLSRLEYGENVAYKNLLTEHYKKHSGSKVFTEINYCFREQRYNSLAADFRINNDSFRIAIKDLNTNGVFNESCADKVFIGPYGKNVSTEEMSFILPNVKYNVFEWNKKQYQLVHIAANGSEIELKQIENSSLTKVLKRNKKIPKFTFKNTKGKYEKIRTYKGKMVYVYFWDKTKITAEDTLYLGKLFRERKDQISIITLNHGDAPKSVYLMQYYDQIIWPMGFSTADIANKYYLEDTPRGYLADKKQKLINDKISPKEVFELL